MSNYPYKVDAAFFHITAACTHACPYCYMADVTAQRPDHPPVERLLRIVTALGESGVREIGFVGGDPASHPDFLQVAKACHDQGMRTSVLSNTHCYKVEEVAPYVDTFETTIHAATASEHDAFCRCAGAYDVVMDKLREAAQLNRNIGLVLNVIPQTAANLFEILHTVIKNESVPVKAVTFQRIIPFGRAQANDAFKLQPSQAKQAFAQMARIESELGVAISVCDPFPLCVVPLSVKKYMHPCQWGLTTVAVDDRGNLSRCGADPRGQLGNMLEKPLLEIWNTSEQLTAFRTRSYLPNSCKNCPKMEACGGGCPLSRENEGKLGADCLLSCGL